MSTLPMLETRFHDRYYSDRNLVPTGVYVYMALLN
jgi:hypothetical protein